MAIPEIRREDLLSPVARGLVGALDAELTRQYPEAGARHFRLDPEEVGPGRGVFLVAYLDGSPAGCGAVRRIDGSSAEVKRMFVRPEARGRGIGAAILSALESEARLLGAERLVLETGTRQREALALYDRAGFAAIPPFGDDLGSPLSVCLAKDLHDAREGRGAPAA